MPNIVKVAFHGDELDTVKNDIGPPPSTIEPTVDRFIARVAGPLHDADVVVEMLDDTLAELQALLGPGADEVPAMRPMTRLRVAADLARRTAAESRNATMSLLAFANETLRRAEANENACLAILAGKNARKTAAIHVVYFVEAKATGLIKIGFTSDVKSRLSSICAASGVAVTLLVTTPGQRDVERAYHDRFSKSREHGEWFRPTADILAEIARLKAGAQ